MSPALALGIHLTMTARISSHVYSGDFNIGLLFFCSANCFLCAGMSCRGVKFRGTIDVSNLSDENDEDDLDVSLTSDSDHIPCNPVMTAQMSVLIIMLLSRSAWLSVKTSPTHLSWSSWRPPASRRFAGFWASMSGGSNQVCYLEDIRQFLTIKSF